MALVALGPLPFARADEAADTAAARILGEDGLALADAGNCDRAIEKLARADKMHHAPTTAGRLAECEIQSGKLIAGTERLHRLLREQLPATAPQIFVDAIARARTVLDQALPRIPMLRISVKTRGVAKVTVTIDGDPIPDAVVDNDRPADPGPHTIRASAIGFVSSAKNVTLNEGETKSVALELETDPYALPLRADISVREAHASSASSGSGALPFVVLGVGAAGLVTGIVAGVVVAAKSSDLATSCGPSKVCPSDKESEISAAKTWATVSTTGFVVAGVGLGAGLVLLLTRHKESHALSSRTELAPVVGPTYVGLTGDF